MTESLLVVDVETTGTNSSIHAPLSLALVPVGAAVPPLEVHVAVPAPTWTDYARANFLRFEGDWRVAAVCPADACQLVEMYLYSHFSGEHVTLVGHNVGFDLAFLGKLASLGGRGRFEQISHRSVDVHTLLYVLFLQGRIPFGALSSDGAFEHFGIRVAGEERHTALGDAVATKALFIRVVGELLGLTHRSDRELIRELEAARAFR